MEARDGVIGNSEIYHIFWSSKDRIALANSMAKHISKAKPVSSSKKKRLDSQQRSKGAPLHGVKKAKTSTRKGPTPKLNKSRKGNAPSSRSNTNTKVNCTNTHSQYPSSFTQTSIFEFVSNNVTPNFPPIEKVCLLDNHNKQGNTLKVFRSYDNPHQSTSCKTLVHKNVKGLGYRPVHKDLSYCKKFCTDMVSTSEPNNWTVVDVIQKRVRAVMRPVHVRKQHLTGVFSVNPPQ